MHINYLAQNPIHKQVVDKSYPLLLLSHNAIVTLVIVCCVFSSTSEDGSNWSKQCEVQDCHTAGLATDHCPSHRKKEKNDCFEHFTPAHPGSEWETRMSWASLVSNLLIPTWSKGLTPRLPRAFVECLPWILPDAGATAVNKAAKAPVLMKSMCLLFYRIWNALLSEALGWGFLACPALQPHILESTTTSETWKLALQPLFRVGGCDWRGKAGQRLLWPYGNIWMKQYSIIPQCYYQTASSCLKKCKTQTSRPCLLYQCCTVVLSLGRQLP